MNPKQKKEERAKQREELLEKGVPENRINSFIKHGIYHDEKTGLMVIKNVNGSITSKKVTRDELMDYAVPHKRRGNPLPVRILVKVKELRPDALSKQDWERIEAWEKKKKKH